MQNHFKNILIPAVLVCAGLLAVPAQAQDAGLGGSLPSSLTPLGTAPTMGTAPSGGSRASLAAPVPGISSHIGPAMTPPRPAGQTFQQRATSCVQSGITSGVRPGQIGSFTQSCVN